MTPSRIFFLFLIITHDSKAQVLNTFFTRGIRRPYIFPAGYPFQSFCRVGHASLLLFINRGQTQRSERTSPLSLQSVAFHVDKQCVATGEKVASSQAETLGKMTTRPRGQISCSTNSNTPPPFLPNQSSQRYIVFTAVTQSQNHHRSKLDHALRSTKTES